MNIELNRLQTFSNWPSGRCKIDPGKIAKAGFYATGNNLEVQCHWCNKKIVEWDYGDQAMSRHRRLDPLCTFVLNPMQSDNVPLHLATSPMAQESPPIDLKNEQCRLATFRNWPVTFITPSSLSKAGFYYFDMADQVKCAWCQGIVGQWEINDNPYTEHQRLFPNCPKVQLGPNIEIARDGIQELGIQQIRPPKQVKYSSLDSRLRTFENWPRRDIQNPEILAQSGFYFQGLDDQVRCFHCNGGLRYWLADDDPWFEHARWFPKCQFILLVKGQQYIKSVQNLQPRTNSIEENLPHPSMTLDQAMSTEPILMGLQMGLHEGRIRAATKRHLEKTGKPFQNAESLVEAVLDGQFIEEESNEMTITNSNCRLPPVPEIDNTNEENLNIILEQFHEVTPTNNIKKNKVQTVIQENNLGSDTTESQTEKLLLEKSPEKLTLEEENRKLKDARLCKVCMDGEVGVVFLPCGHLVTCCQCAPSVTICPLCRTAIKGFVRTFLS